ncbi:hypothetical protein FisN_6Hh391 [Fistulifera solaris]|uniref:Cyclin N-terminal domain-containing protein n=1 Tax=Fistulifera solaris TaxID=1519565 RepID=A0A1Z5KEU2_FISSO|nr:hypothetical protein FisN_6Hh391 [Fistulifera solaris]|eukprot:GAX24840.1 hypothetical protein FisN_6Hh391 [Fistulifera solaris]
MRILSGPPFALLLLSSSWSSCTAEVASIREIPRPHLQRTTSSLPIKVEEVALALRWTGEMNRRLFLASQQPFGVQRIRDETEELPQSKDPFRGGQASVYRIASTPRPSTVASDTITVFHAKRLYEGNAQGARRWGPELSQYLHTLVSFFGSDFENTMSITDLTLAMIFMDRACSVETPRSDGHSPCPYCTPRTVHRLLVASVLVAVEANRGAPISEELRTQLSKVLGIPHSELEHMVDWVRGALGDQGTFVSSEQLQDFALTWKSRFGTTLLPMTTEHAAKDVLVLEQTVSA